MRYRSKKNHIKNSGIALQSHTGVSLSFSYRQVYPRNEISTPAATAEPITPEILLDIQ